jgi:hypothetical protein
MNKLKNLALAKSAIALSLLLSISTFSFAAPSEVYNSEANLSNLSLKEVTQQTWVWLLVAGVVVIAVTAFFAAQAKEHNETAAH